MKNIPFEFATHDDCLSKMVPSDLRGLISERDSSIAKVHELEVELKAELGHKWTAWAREQTLHNELSAIKAVQGELVGQFTVSGGRTLNDRVFFETGLPDGNYKLHAQAL